MGDAIVWWIALQLMGLAALPIGSVLLRALPDRGYSVSKPLGLLLVGWLAYMLAMAHILHFDRLSLVICLVVVATLSVWLLLRSGRALLYDLQEHFRTRWAYVLVCEVLFLVAYVIWAWVRSHNPSIVDQEKFMDYGFLNSILKSDTFPPNDMWLAGFSINYYYFGYILIAGLTALSGVATSVAFNLANVTLYALTALGAFGIVHNLISARLLAAGRTARRDTSSGMRDTRSYPPERAIRPSRPPRQREREDLQSPVEQPKRRQTVPASGPRQSRKQPSATVPVPASALPSRRPRPQPAEVEETAPEEQVEQTEFQNDVDTTSEVMQEQAEGSRPRVGRRSRKAAAEEPVAEPEPEAATETGTEAPVEAEPEPEPEAEEMAGVGEEVEEAPEEVPVVPIVPPRRASRTRTRDDGQPTRDLRPPRADIPQSTIRIPHSDDPPYLPAGPAGGEPRRVPGYLSPYIFAVIAALMVVAMGNLTVAFAVKDRGSAQQGQAFSEGNGFTFCFLCNHADGYNWFAPSRVIADFSSASGTKQTVGFETINEFPAFSFLLADMHPHVLALPLVMLIISVGMALARRRVIRAEEWRDGIPPGFNAWLSIAVTGLIAGSLYTTNTWDFPTYTLLLLLCLLFPYLAAGRRLAVGWRWLMPFIVQVVLIIFFALFLFLPFHLTFKSLVGGDQTSVPDNIANIPVVGWVAKTLSSLFLINNADKTILGFIVIFGIFLFSLLVWLLYEFASYMRRRYQAGDDINRSLIFWGAFLLLTFLAAFLLKFPLLALLLPIIVVCFGLIWLEPRRTERNFALILVGVAALIGLTIEVVFLRDNFQMRMNTLFKFYFQIWILWALPAAYAVWRVLYAALGDRAEQVEAQRYYGYFVPTSRTKLIGMTLAPIWTFGFLFLVLTGCLYSYYGAVARQGVGTSPLQGLDGTTWMQGSLPDDYAAVNWLKANGTGNDRLIEASGAEYDWAGRMASYSGVPSLIGWDNSHESLWRTNQPDAKQQISTRRSLVNSIYQGIDPNGGNLTAQRLLDLLKQYKVTYVVDGQIEHGKREGTVQDNPSEDVSAYAESLFKYALTPAFTSPSGGAVIYKVGDTPAAVGAIPPTPVPGANTTPGVTPTIAPPTVDLNAPAKGIFDAAGPGANRGQFDLPRGIARDAQGDFYVADTQNLRIQKFDKDGKFITMFGSKGDGDGQFAQLNGDAQGTGPGGIAVDANGNVYVADTWGHRIQKFDKDGKFLLAWGGFVNLGDATSASDTARDSKFYGPRGVAIGPDGNIYVTDTGNKRVLIFTSDGKAVGKFGSDVTPDKITQNDPFNKPGELNEPIGIAVDKDNNIYVADTRNARIQKFSKDGKSLGQWSVAAPMWDLGPYLEPFLALDGAGNVYVTAPTGKAILKYNSTGTLVGQKSGSFQLPTGIWADPDGTLYVVDTNAHSVVNFGKVP